MMLTQNTDTGKARAETLATQKKVVRQGSGSLLQNMNDWLSIRSLLLAFFTMFWLFNGLDKFLNRLPFWFGDAREAKFIGYFAHIHLPPWLALTTLNSFGVVEILLGVSFLYALLRGHTQAAVSQLSFKVSVLIFFTYSMGDIIFGDRAELLEHGTYLILILVSFAFFLRSGSE